MVSKSATRDGDWMTIENMAEAAIRKQVEYARTTHENTGLLPVGTIDQEASQMRENIKAALGDRPITDDILLGMALGAWAFHGALASVVNTPNYTAERVIELLPAIDTMTIVWIDRIRQGISAGFDWAASFGGGE